MQADVPIAISSAAATGDEDEAAKSSATPLNTYASMERLRTSVTQ